MAGRPRLPLELDRRFWAQVRAGLVVEDAARAAGVSVTWARRRFLEAGGVNPIPVRPPQGRYLSLEEREQIAILAGGGTTVADIAAELGRDRSTIHRELGRGASRKGYRASVGQAVADKSRRGPRGNAKLVTNLRLRSEVQARLARLDSPEQIAGRLRIDFPDDPEMRGQVR